MIPTRLSACAAFVFAMQWAGAGVAEEDILRIGQDIAQAHCGRCHATGRQGSSPLSKAPPFRTLIKRYPLNHLAEALAEGIMTGHPDMPEFTFEPDEIEALLDYIDSISDGN